MLVLLVDCHCYKVTAYPLCISSQYHVIPSFAEPPCISSDCELRTILHLVQTLSICPTVLDLTICWILIKCSARDLHTTIISS